MKKVVVFFLNSTNLVLQFITTYNIYVRVTEKMVTDTVDRFENYTNSLDIPNNEEILYKD